MNTNTMPMAVLTIDGMQLAELRQAVLNNYQPPRATILDLIDLLAVQPETPEPLAIQRQHAYLKGLREAKAIVWMHLVETGRKSRDLAAAHDLLMGKTSIAYAALECMRTKGVADAIVEPVADVGIPTGWDGSWRWMTHPDWNFGEPMPVQTWIQGGTVYYRPFDCSATDFEWAKRDNRWKEVPKAKAVEGGAA